MSDSPRSHVDGQVALLSTRSPLVDGGRTARRARPACRGGAVLEGTLRLR
ncbi:hypothetical protein SAMN05428996_1381 [Quadrisphaera sp. DSM 44207]|nr:hypothetical protein SAMN05428996_1381 [Quadrisphaera sp. DSM 44207]